MQTVLLTPWISVWHKCCSLNVFVLFTFDKVQDSYRTIIIVITKSEIFTGLNFFAIIMVPDLHHFNADPDPAFHFNADPDPDLAFHLNSGFGSSWKLWEFRIPWHFGTGTDPDADQDPRIRTSD